MTRYLLRAFNAPGLILLVLVGLAIQTSLFGPYPLNFFQPDVVLIAVIWCALKRNFYEGGLITLILGDFCEVHSAAPQGQYLLTYMSSYLTVRACNRYFLLPARTSIVVLTGAFSIFAKLITVGLLLLLDAPEGSWKTSLSYLFPTALSTSIFSFWIYRLLEKYDWVTYKDPRARQALDEELGLEEEGL